MKCFHNRYAMLLLAALLLGGCGRAGTPDGLQAPGGQLPVVATTSIIGDLVSRIGGDRIRLTTLVGPGADAHTFTPGPADAAALAQAELIVENGAGFEPWLDDLYAASGTPARRAAASAGLEMISGDGTYDPHVWHSVANAVGMVATIRAALAGADPANASTYEANAAAFTAELQTLDEWVFEQVKRVPPERRKLVTTHDTFGYFAQRYGFQILGTLLPTTTEGASPSAQQVAALADAVRAAGVPAVFGENITANDLLAQVAAEAGVQVVGSLYTDALGPAGSGADSYGGMMRSNVETIVAALAAD